jgi:Uma2 family endonuclease
MSALRKLIDNVYTFQEYLALEEQAEFKSEYYDGHIVAMAGASANHGRITKNACFALDQAMGNQPCETFMSDLKVWVKSRRRGYYPDVVLICGKLEFFQQRTDTITNPKVIIEVLSTSTERVDRSDKFHAYWSLESFAEYILIDQYRVHVEYFRRDHDNLWELQVFTDINDSVTIKSVGVELPLAKIYQNVTFESE